MAVFVIVIFAVIVVMTVAAIVLVIVDYGLVVPVVQF